MKKFALVLLALATALAITPAALADSLQLLGPPFGSTNISTASTSVTPANLNGTLLATLTNSVAGASGFVGSLTEQVYEGGADALCPTCLSFVYSVSNTGTGTDTIGSISTTSFAGYTTEEGNVVGTGDYVSEGYDNNGTVHLNFMSGIMPGQTLDTFVLFTNATGYGPGTINFLDGSVATNGALIPTPEPSGLLLLGSGLLGLALTFRKTLMA